MLKAHWHGYEIDSSEAAIRSRCPNRSNWVHWHEDSSLLATFRSYYLIFEEPMTR